MSQVADPSKSLSFLSLDEKSASRSTAQLNLGKRVSTFLIRYGLIEFVAIACVCYLTSLIYSQVAWTGWTAGRDYITSGLILASGVLVVSLSFLRHYSAFQRQPNHRVLWNAATSVLVTFAFFQFGLFLLKELTDYSRAAFLMQLVTVFALVLAMRTIAHAKVRAAIASDRIEGRRAVIIGGNDDQALVGRQLKQAGVKVVRTLPFPDRHSGVTGEPDLAEICDTIEACRAARPDDIVIVTKAARLSKSAGLADFLSELPVSVHLVPVDTGVLLGSARVGEIGSLVTVEAVRSPLSVADESFKRLFDIVAAASGLLLLSPLLLIVAAAIKLDSRGPVLFRQVRHGYNNDKILVCKFRTMSTMESGNAFTQVKKDDPRVTRIGKVLRRSNIDELPQLINVLLGQMSLVGPRPHPVAMNLSFEQHISRLSRRHNVKPGITGWAQVNGYRGETDTLEKMQRRLECDLYYIDNWSFLLDVKIILMTLFTKSAYKNAF